MKTKLISTIAVAGFAFALSACGGGDATTEDANDVPRSDVNFSPPAVVAMPNNYKNVAIKCDTVNGVGHGRIIYEMSDGVRFIVPDPGCPGYVKGETVGPTLVETVPGE